MDSSSDEYGEAASAPKTTSEQEIDDLIKAWMNANMCRALRCIEIPCIGRAHYLIPTH